MPDQKSSRGHDFGTTQVVLAAISSIVGAMLFLRFGYAVAHAGKPGVIGISLYFFLAIIAMPIS